MMKVRATQRGVYENRAIEVGDVFEIDEKDFADATKSPFGWMVQHVEEPPKKTPEAKPVAPPKPAVVDRRSEVRDPGEHEQNLAKERGLPAL